MKKIALPVLGVIIFLTAMLAFHFFVPTNVTATDDDIVKIRVFDGNDGTETIITSEAQIERIVTMLNDIEFLKTGVSIGYIGYSYDVTYYTASGEEVQQFIVNNEKQIRYEGFFYEAQNGAIDTAILTGDAL